LLVLQQRYGWEENVMPHPVVIQMMSQMLLFGQYLLELLVAGFIT
jgi:hypothetical protein